MIKEIADFCNLQSAYHKAQKGKFAKPGIYLYGKNLDGNLRVLREEILSGNVTVGNYHFFTVYDPKKRVVCAAPFPQRVLHHAIMNVCHPTFEKVQIDGSFASRKGKGTFAAVEQAKSCCGRFKWFCKLDVRKYFDSLDHTVLKGQLGRMFKDRLLSGLFDRIIDSYHVVPEKGVPIGNLTSQYFANHYLASADHFIKEELSIPAYVRYMDDMVLWHADKEELKRTTALFNEYLSAKLLLKLKPVCINDCTRGLPFLGFLIFPDRIRLSRRSQVRFVAKVCEYEEKLNSGQWSQEEYRNHIVPLVAFTEHAEACGFRKRLFYSDEKGRRPLVRTV